MKLARIKTTTGIHPALIGTDGRAHDISAVVGDITAQTVTPEGMAQMRSIDPSDHPVIQGEYAPVLDDIRRIFCIGLNYSDHAEEAGMPIPSEPILFMKSCPATGANDDVILPRGSEKTDWEVELGVVIGTRAHHVDERDALAHVAGYCIVNDLSERAYQTERGGQWTKGKSCDSFAPVGPWLVDAADVPDPQSLPMYLDVNSARRQTGTTATMIFGVAHIISYLSRFVTLMPGDLITTGTPPGVGMGMKPPQYLKAGDVMELGIEGLGVQRQPVVAYRP
ncbi:fumarylacetoacetate hydrolase family protein [Sulfitobacter guttiformis]|uniref:2-hydroxyhepta-2,4-diene-1, 7-dioateisomerase/5-carboxymethyl-2-oxo-hex-3-ene-1, 7-dioatedecarboxylase n=1 Tax=Sulfitobacter guttiformis TaxID=74349 RepID=J7G4Q3_9RHOB|nr:fumarylacetoacetate hydrolase family protein [Sulfitobacter guttiformis]AFP55426.1 2-hydroxyhepta-2,4-diene-1, 7-dioateisomerase/5-carboxymethyl-2-oxo-hex-3-ene-1, 7-dioatedecarboxylase [Sulfitobacter guttiformis]KIN75447.1 2-hydroxyhepta-2,4-diene-1, 7-dioateisomerase/5-carboxymethyl-2-oxo-hex-3-ene-1, 7-dioatedecarboxylase [Sulfitobacter guttiformis KCTC 32187]RKE92048.1 2-keto-4-pentenoate hydratase/2-oxohepta-3-ene-1,7-dioic acid hydratase in catechol pathway [Sulfitobacter guttiformis]